MRTPLLVIPIASAALVSCGCSVLKSHPPAKYATILADPHRDEAKAIAKTRRAAALFRKGKWDQAEQLLQEALVADVTYGPAHNDLGILYYEQGKLYLAAWEFEYASKLMPHHPEPYNNLGMVYEAVDRLDQAIEYYSMAHRMAGQNAEYIGNLARAHLKRDEHAPEVSGLLSELVFYDTRPDWVAWAREQLAVAKLPVPPPSSGGVLQSDKQNAPESIPLGDIMILPDPPGDMPPDAPFPLEELGSGSASQPDVDRADM